MTLPKAFLTMSLLVVLGGGLSACAGMPFGDYKNQLESIVAVSVAGTYEVAITRNGQVLLKETWDCTMADGKLTGCHKRAAVPAALSVK